MFIAKKKKMSNSSKYFITYNFTGLEKSMPINLVSVQFSPTYSYNLQKLIYFCFHTQWTYSFVKWTYSFVPK